MKQKVALVLSSGGARGVAHIGVIEAIAECGMEIHSISGSSIGALIGGIYATGHLEEYKKWICELKKYDVFSLMDFSFSGNGLIKGERVFKELEKFFSDVNIEDLPIDFKVSATDLISKSQIVYDQGSIIDAIRASVAIPTVLQPVYTNNQLLVDGGVINPLPINAVKRIDGDILVAVNVNAHVPYIKSEKKEELQKEQEYEGHINFFRQKLMEMISWQKESETKKLGFFDLLTESIDLMQDRICSSILNEHRPHILVNLSKDSAGVFEYYRSERIIKEGKEAFKEQCRKYRKSVYQNEK
ncbi:MAG: patatin-like phospholipase family protein [Bacteroidota bacterium]